MIMGLSCSDAQLGERDAWLSSTLIEDHFHLISRSPDLVSGKFKKMVGLNFDGSSTLYPYMRGSLSQMYRDLSGDYIQAIPSRYSSPEGLLTYLIGDPHIENVSSALDASGKLALDWDDFDSAGYGPWIWDVRRLALSLWVLCYDLGDTQLADSLVASMGEGYIKGTRQWSIGARVKPLEGDSLPLSIEMLFEKSREQSEDHRALNRYTVIGNDGTGVLRRSLLRGEIRPPKQTGVMRDVLTSLNRAETMMINRFIDELREQKPLLGALKDVTRKFGQGVSSYPLMRFYLLFEGPSLRLDDDELWEAKELADRPAPPGLNLYPPRQFGAQGQRVLKARRALQWLTPSAQDHESRSTWIDVGNVSFRARKIDDVVRGLNTRDLIKFWQNTETSLAAAELKELSHLLGALLASAHCHAETLNGLSGGAVISRDLEQGDIQYFNVELLNFVETYGPQVELDRAFLLALLTERGPLLGLRSSHLGK